MSLANLGRQRTKPNDKIGNKSDNDGQRGEGNGTQHEAGAEGCEREGNQERNGFATGNQ